MTNMLGQSEVILLGQHMTNMLGHCEVILLGQHD